jgi:7-carboxy-7-deazaguanine synthase
MSLKISEIFYSLQGEGRFMGVPSIFLRTFGCNFKCRGFGMPAGELSVQADAIANNGIQYHSYDELPLVTTGCDSYAAIYPQFKHLSPAMSIDEIVDRMIALLPNGEWGGVHLVITGGEPLLPGWQQIYPELLKHPKLAELKNITFETNGTQELLNTFEDYLYQERRYQTTFSISPKLSVSGEPREKAIRPEIVTEYQFSGHGSYLKFVVASEDDVTEALEVMQLYKDKGFKGEIYLMPVGGVTEVYNLNNQRVAELALQHGLRYSDRLHLPLFGNNWGT